jgi:hypothetical protein
MSILGAALTFLFGILFILVVLWGINLVLPKLGLPDDIASVVRAIIGLILLIGLIWLVMGALGIGGAPRLFPW